MSILDISSMHQVVEKHTQGYDQSDVGASSKPHLVTQSNTLVSFWQVYVDIDFL